MSSALRMSICIQEVEDTIKGLNERKKNCETLVRALYTVYSHASAEDRANYTLGKAKWHFLTRHWGFTQLLNTFSSTTQHINTRKIKWIFEMHFEKFWCWHVRATLPTSFSVLFCSVILHFGISSCSKRYSKCVFVKSVRRISQLF